MGRRDTERGGSFDRMTAEQDAILAGGQSLSQPFRTCGGTVFLSMPKLRPGVAGCLQPLAWAKESEAWALRQALQEAAV